MSPQGFHKAVKRPEVRDYVQKVQLEFIASVEGEKSIYKARAYEVGMDLMLNSKSETVRARMVEFFAGDGKASPVSVHVDARHGAGYEYVRPDQQVVEIQPGKRVAQQELGSDTAKNCTPPIEGD